jgi:transposase
VRLARFRAFIDETGLFDGELYTVVTSRDCHGGEGCPVAIVAGTKAEVVIEASNHILEEVRETVEEITPDLPDSMRKTVRCSFPRALRVTDRFHIQKLACDAVQEIRIKHRWDAHTGR